MKRTYREYQLWGDKEGARTVRVPMAWEPQEVAEKYHCHDVVLVLSPGEIMWGVRHMGVDDPACAHAKGPARLWLTVGGDMIVLPDSVLWPSHDAITDALNI